MYLGQNEGFNQQKKVKFKKKWGKMSIFAPNLLLNRYVCDL